MQRQRKKRITKISIHNTAQKGINHNTRSILQKYQHIMKQATFRPQSIKQKLNAPENVTPRQLQLSTTNGAERGKRISARNPSWLQPKLTRREREVTQTFASPLGMEQNLASSAPGQHRCQVIERGLATSLLHAVSRETRTFRITARSTDVYRPG